VIRDLRLVRVLLPTTIAQFNCGRGGMVQWLTTQLSPASVFLALISR